MSHCCVCIDQSDVRVLLRNLNTLLKREFVFATVMSNANHCGAENRANEVLLIHQHAGRGTGEEITRISLFSVSFIRFFCEAICTDEW